MDRRKYLKAMTVGSIGAATLIQSCEPGQKQAPPEKQPPAAAGPERQPEEMERYNRIVSDTFFDEHETATIAVLADLIIPKDDVSGSATEAGVPAFIEFIVKDMPEYQTPMRGGLRWLDVQCMRRYDNAFVNCTSDQQTAMLDEIAFPEEAKPEMQQGVAFFSTMRNLTATGFFTSKMGIADLGYQGNTPNQWDGVPQEVLDQYGLKYDERTLKESVKFDNA